MTRVFRKGEQSKSHQARLLLGLATLSFSNHAHPFPDRSARNLASQLAPGRLDFTRCFLQQTTTLMHFFFTLRSERLDSFIRIA